MTVDELVSWWSAHGQELLGSLDEGSYRPSPVRRVEIPKPGGGRRILGVPTVVDRLVQQAIYQVLLPIFDPAFSEQSFGFRPGRGAHQAVETARGLVADGYRWVVDVDLDAFFDRVNHDLLMARVARRVADKRLLRLVRRFLEAGVMADGVRQPTEEGTPQGSPLSPLLSNIMLDDLDRELERRGHRFVRYADDLRIFVRSERAAKRVLDGITDVVESRLKLKVNRAKSGVFPAGLAVLLGFGFYLQAGEVKIRVDRRAVRRLKGRIRQLTRRHGGRSIQQVIGQVNRFITGWMAFFRIAEFERLFKRLDEWLRRRLRAIQWVLWKTPGQRVRMLRAGGIPERTAYPVAHSRSGPWRLANNPAVNMTLPNQHWADQGLTGFLSSWHRLRNP